MAFDYETDERVMTECGDGDECGHEEEGYHESCVSCGYHKISVYAVTDDLVCAESGESIREGESVFLNDDRTGYVKMKFYRV